MKKFLGFLIVAIVAFVIPIEYFAMRDLFTEPPAPVVPVKYERIPPPGPLRAWITPEETTTPTPVSKLLAERFGL